MQLTIEIKSRDVENIIAKLKNNLQNRAPLMAGIAAELAYITDLSFSNEADADGKKWKPLALSTIRQREKDGSWPGKILHGSGTAGLRDSITPFSDNDTAGISSNKPYALIHQLGGEAGRSRGMYIPARSYMPIKKNGDNLELSDNATRSILQTTNAYFFSDL